MSYWKQDLQIGHLSFPRFIGGPLDGVTDSSFRKVIRDFSTDALLYTEMRHVACVASDKGGKKALSFDQIERPLNFQMTANGTENIELACEKVLEKGVDIVDLNIGCPARNVVGSGSVVIVLSRKSNAWPTSRRIGSNSRPHGVDWSASFVLESAERVGSTGSGMRTMVSVKMSAASRANSR